MVQQEIWMRHGFFQTFATTKESFFVQIGWIWVFYQVKGRESAIMTIGFSMQISRPTYCSS